MSGSFCHKLLQNLSFHFEEMRLSYVANCVINGFPSYTAIMLNCVTIYDKNFVVAKASKNIASDSGCFWSWCWLTSSTFLYRVNIQPASRERSQLYHFYRFRHLHDIVFLYFLLRCDVANCWQILGHSSSSQIPGTCDSQSCCCCGDLNVGFWFLSFITCCLDTTDYGFQDFRCYQFFFVL